MMDVKEGDDGSLAGDIQSPKEITEIVDKYDHRDMTKTPPPISTGKSKRNAKRGKAGKKPADMPRRPLSGYNYFFSEQKSQILEEQSKVKDEKKDIFTTLGRIVADRWKKLKDKEKGKYNDLAAKDLIRYRKEMEKYNEKIAMRNRKESEKARAEESANESAKAATTLSTAQTDASAGERPHNTLLQEILDAATPNSVDATASSLGQYTGGMPLQGYNGLAGPDLGLPGGLVLYPQAAQSTDMGRLTLAQYQNMALRVDQGLLGRADIQTMLGQLPPPPESTSRIHILYPPTASGTGQQPALQLSSPISQAPLSASGLLTLQGGGADATLLQNLGVGGSSGSDASALRGLGTSAAAAGAAGAPSDSALLGHIRQQRENESIRQAYVQLLQRQQAEEEVIRQLRQRQWPPSSGGDGRYPY